MSQLRNINFLVHCSTHGTILVWQSNGTIRTLDWVPIPLRPSDFHNFSLPIGEMGPTYTITFDLWINSIRDGKAFVFRIGNSTRQDGAENESCGNEMPSVATKENNGHFYLAVRFDCNNKISQEYGKDIRKRLQRQNKNIPSHG